MPTRVPGLLEADAADWPLLERGDHRRPGAPVERRFLEAIDPTPFDAEDSGRLQLAEALAAPSNPLTARACSWQVAIRTLSTSRGMRCLRGASAST